MFEAYKIAVSVALTGNVTAALGMWKREFQETGKMTSELQKQLDSMRNTGKRAALELAAAFTMASPFKAMLTDAAKLQKEMIGIGLGARGSAADLTNLRGIIEDVAGRTMFSNIDVAKMAKKLSTSTGWDRNQIGQDLPAFAQFADAQQIMKGTPYEQSVTTGVTLAHQAGYSKPGDISRYLDLLTKASMIVPGGLGEVANALKYAQPDMKNVLGIGDNDTIMLTALMNRMGASGSRGGTSLSASLVRSIPGLFGSGLLTGKSQEALRAMGMADEHGHATFMQDGKFSVMKWMQQLSDYEGREYAQHPEGIARQNIMKNLRYALGTNGARAAELLSTPQARDALGVVRQQLQNGSGTALVQQTFADQSVLQQFNNAKTNMTTLMSELGYKLLPAATFALQAFNTEIGKLTGWVRNPKHDTEVKAGLGLGIAGVTALGIGSAVNFIRWASQGLKLSASASPAVGAASGIGLGTVAGVAGGITVIGAAAKGAYDEHYGVGERWAAQHPESFRKFENAIDKLTFGLLKPKDDTQIAVYLDSSQIAAKVEKRMGNSMSMPFSTGSDFDPRMSLTPAGQ